MSFWIVSSISSPIQVNKKKITKTYCLSYDIQPLRFIFSPCLPKNTHNTLKMHWFKRTKRCNAFRFKEITLIHLLQHSFETGTRVSQGLPNTARFPWTLRRKVTLYTWESTVVQQETRSVGTPGKSSPRMTSLAEAARRLSLGPGGTPTVIAST